jgi:Uma2 family endonuclease
MSSGPAHRKYSIREFLQLEGYSNVRHEYLDGQIYAMAGGTPEHGTYAANVIGLLTAALRDRPCRVQTSDVRIRVVATGLDTYPDVSVVCGQAERDKEDPDAIVNPIVLVEVLSPSTEE